MGRVWGFTIIMVLISESFVAYDARAEEYNIENIPQKSFDYLLSNFKDSGSNPNYNNDVEFSRAFIAAMSNPKYWDEFARYFSENNVRQKTQTDNGERSMACNLNFTMSLLDLGRRKAFLENSLKHLEQLGIDLNGQCYSGTVYERLQSSLYEDSSGTKVYTESDFAGAQSKPLSEDEMLIRAIDNKDGCHYSYNDEEKPMTEWSGSHTFTGIRDCGKCSKVVDRKKKMDIFWANQKAYFEKLKTSGSKTIVLVKTLPELLKLDPNCQSYIMIYNFPGEDAARLRLRPLSQPSNTDKTLESTH